MVAGVQNTSNYNWTKHSFVYFGVSLGEDPDKTKA